MKLIKLNEKIPCHKDLVLCRLKCQVESKDPILLPAIFYKNESFRGFYRFSTYYHTDISIYKDTFFDDKNKIENVEEWALMPKANVDDLKKEPNFNSIKKSLLDKIEFLYNEYSEFTKVVSPKNWRLAGTHYHNIKKMKDEVADFSEITKEEKEIEWVKKSLSEN